MSTALYLLGIFSGILFGPSQFASAEDRLIHIEAVVTKYETAAMEDILADGRSVAYDAVTFKIISPAKLAARTMRVFFPLDSVPKDSPMRKSGERFRYGLETKLAKEPHLFHGALRGLKRVKAKSAAQPAHPGPGRQTIDPNLLEAILKQLSRWEEDAATASRSEWPRPSQQLAYYLLAGLAEQGQRVEQMSDAERQLFDVKQRGGTRSQLVAVSSDVRVALIDSSVQDKSGSYRRKTAVLYVRKQDRWSIKGRGVITADAYPDSPRRK